MLLGVSHTFDLTGAWEGHYLQSGRRHGISMHVVQRGQSFVGRMRDVDTLLASHEVLHAMEGGGDGKTREVVGEAEVLLTLPEHSSVEGEIEQRVVTFVKSYQGKSSTSVWVEGKANMTFEVPGHQVQYRGVLATDGNVLSGHWRIEPKQHGGELLRDRFELRRVGA